MSKALMQEEVLLIDAQLFQTGAWDRGMGAYSLSLLEAYAKQQDHLKTTFILNKNLKFPEHKKERLLDIFPDANFALLDLPSLAGDIPAARRHAKRILTNYIRTNHTGRQINFLILSLFMFDYCSAFPDGVKKMLLFYDFIPLIRWNDFSSYFPERLYFPHLTTVLEADILLAISETTKRQLENILSIPSARVINLNGARIKREAAKKQTEMILPERFILMPSADLPHKNNINAVQAFAQFNREFGDSFTLVITSTFSDKTKKQLDCYSEKLLFTGNVSEEILAHLYKKSEAVMLVSHIEGLGLPLLEAASYNKPVICSTISVFEEISDKAFYFCPPDRPSAIASALVSAIAKKDWYMRLEEYKRIATKYSWDTSAQTFAQGMQLAASDTVVKVQGKGFVAVLPHPATTSGDLGQMVQSLAHTLTRRAHFKFYVSADEYVNVNQKPYFLESIAPAALVQNCSPDVLRQAKPLYFLDETTASVDVALRALAYPSVCFTASKRLSFLLKSLTQAGYLDEAIAKEWTARFGRDGMVTLLESVGNTVYFLNDLPGFEEQDNQQVAEQILSKL